MRQSYDLSPQTKGALEDHVKAVADEMDISATYLYNILAGTATDPYSPFRRLFRAIARTRPDQAKHYLIDLQSLIPKTAKTAINGSVASALTNVSKAYFELVEAHGEGVDRDELKAFGVKLVAQGNQLMQILDPTPPMLVGVSEKETKRA